jgi:hypothetical protein
MKDIYWVIITQIITSVILIIKIYGKSYLAEKGKNLAQKEDIEEITNKIEGIKSLYKKESDLLKEQISHLLDIQSSHRTEERNAIIHFHETYYHWIYTILEIPVDSYNFNTINLLLDKKAELQDYFININKASARMVLLVKNDELIGLSNELIKQLIHFKGWAELKLLKLQFKLEEKDSLISKFTKLFANYENNRQELNTIATSDTALAKEITDFVNEYKQAKVAEFSKCISLSKKFESIAKNYLTSIS